MFRRDSDMAWHAMVWYGMVWYVLVCLGMSWYVMSCHVMSSYRMAYGRKLQIGVHSKFLFPISSQ